MIIVTGGAGFIGSNIVKSLNEDGYNDIIIVDSLNLKKENNIKDCKYTEIIDKDKFIKDRSNILIQNSDFLFHQGACSDTTNLDENYMNNNNFIYSKILLDKCIEYKCNFIYASSAAVYGLGKNGFEENPKCENPLNPYAKSKLDLDNYVRSKIDLVNIQIVGLRYFNVFGKNEAHKGKMSSVFFHFFNQNKLQKKVRIFKGDELIKDGEHLRDFIDVSDCININLFFMRNPNLSGIFNAGTGIANSYNSVAGLIIKYMGYGKKEYIDFPVVLKGRYQSFTRANLNKLRATGYNQKPTDLAYSVENYLNWLNENYDLNNWHQ